MCYCVYVQARTSARRLNANVPGDKHTMMPLFFQATLRTENRSVLSWRHESFALRNTSEVKGPLSHSVLHWGASAVLITRVNLFITAGCNREHVRFTVVQHKVHSLLTVKLDVPGQILVSVSIYAHRKAWLPLLPSTKHSRVISEQPITYNHKLHV